MRNNIFGYIFILFIIIIMGFAIYRVKIQNADKNNYKMRYWTFKKFFYHILYLSLSKTKIFKSENPIIINKSITEPALASPKSKFSKAYL